MLIYHHNAIEKIVMEEAKNFTNQAFELLIQEVLHADIWNGNLLNHLNRYGLDELMDELVDYTDLGGDYRVELERLMMISITREYCHRIHPLILEYEDSIDFSLENITYHKSNLFLIDEELPNDQDSRDIANEIIECLKRTIIEENHSMVKMRRLLKLIDPC